MNEAASRQSSKQSDVPGDWQKENFIEPNQFLGQQVGHVVSM